VVVHDVFHGVASEAANLLEPVLQNIPDFLCRLDRCTLVLGNLLDLVVGLLDDLVDFITMLAADGVEVVECRVDVAASARDESGVAEGGTTKPFKGFIWFGCCVLELLCCL